MYKIKLALIILLSLGLILVAVQNTASVQASFLWFSGEVPVILLLVISGGGGLILGLLVAIFSTHYKKRDKKPDPSTIKRTNIPEMK